MKHLYSVILIFFISSTAMAADEHARAMLIADTSAISAGQTFTLGVRIDLDPKWHIYWTNPGDSGIATKVKISAPAGFVVGEVQFPTPHRFVETGNIVLFGYENSVLLMAKVMVPKDLPKDFSGEFEADVSWLVCQDECIPEKARVNLSISAGKTTPANVELFDKYKAEIPIDAADSSDVNSTPIPITLSAGNTHSSGIVSIDIQWNIPAPENVCFFAGPSDAYEFSNMKVASNKKNTQITCNVRRLAGQAAANKHLESVIGYSDSKGEWRGIKVNVPLLE